MRKQTGRVKPLAVLIVVLIVAGFTAGLAFAYDIDETAPSLAYTKLPGKPFDSPTSETVVDNGDGTFTFTQIINDQSTPPHYITPVNGGGFGIFTMYDQDFGWQHNFDVSNPNLLILDATLTIRAWDVDFGQIEYNLWGEYDGIFVDGIYLNPQSLQGADLTWSVTVFDLPLSVLTDNILDVWIDIDRRNEEWWGTTLDYSQLDVKFTYSNNSPPYQPQISLSPTGCVSGGDGLVVTVVGPSPADPDGDPVTYEYKWFVDFGHGFYLDDEFIGRGDHTGNTVPSADTLWGDKWKVVVTPVGTFMMGGYPIQAHGPMVEGVFEEIQYQTCNQPPVADANGGYFGEEGSGISLDGSAIWDPDADPLVFSWDVDSPLCSFNDPSSAAPILTCADNGSFTVTLVVDDGVFTDSDTAAVSVANVAPVVNAGADQTMYEGDTFNLAPANFSDASTLDTHTATIDWGDGSLPEGPFAVSGGTVSGSHVFDDNGAYIVSVCVIDDDTAETCDTLTVKVKNVKPTATFSAPPYVIAGESFELSLIDPFDPSSADTAAGFAYRFDCGDGSGFNYWGPSSTATCSTSPNEVGVRTVRGRIRDKDFGVTEYTVTVTVLPPSAATDSALCYYDRDPEIEGQQFGLIFTPDMQTWPAYKLPASNPGQFFYNVFYLGGGPASFDITIPEPFVTQWANPVHVYTEVELIGVDGFNCFVPDPDSEIFAGDFDGLSGLTDFGGFLHIAVHLDFDLKGTTGYIPNANSDALDAADEVSVLIPNLDTFTFSVSGSQNDSQMIQNINDFKKIPGFGGLVMDGANPVGNATVEIYLDGAFFSTATADEDGWYMLVYKHTGKPIPYTVVLDGLEQSGLMKANKFIEANFTLP